VAAWWVFRHQYLPSLRYQMLPLLAVPLGNLRSHLHCVTAWPDDPVVLGPRVAVFCHFDADGAVRPDVLRYLAAVRAAGFDVAVVSNSTALRPEAMTSLQAICQAVIVRRNVGYDFCAWREALERLALPRDDTELVLLANDSVYGPLRPLGPCLQRIAGGEADVWGLTDSRQIRFHLQSYFLAVSRAALQSEAWRRFWCSVRPVPSKRAMILRYELGLTQQLLRAGLRCRAVWPVTELPRPDSLRQRQTDEVNPTHELWRQLLDAGFPFIKRELVRDNPAHVPDIAEWRQVVQPLDGRELAEIEQDLRRGVTP
jgi:lipopolysaccharide biosynthesis protein